MFHDGASSPPPSAKALRTLLHTCCLDASKFGTQGFSSLEALRQELETNLCRLKTSDGYLTLLFERTSIKIRSKVRTALTDKSMTLIVVKRLFPDGSWDDTRTLPDVVHFGGETWRQATLRWMQEDLGLLRDEAQELIGTATHTWTQERGESVAYPGVLSIRRVNLVS